MTRPRPSSCPHYDPCADDAVDEGIFEGDEPVEGLDEFFN